MIPNSNQPEYQMQYIHEESVKDISILDEINKKHQDIQNITADTSIEIYGFHLPGKLFYAKDKKFRMTAHSFFGQEIDLGSNEEMFWFWLKRMKPKGLYFAKHNQKNRLRTVLNPIYVMSCLGLSKIQGDSVDYHGKWAIINDRLIYLVDKENYLVTQQFIFDKNDQLLASCATEFENGLPKKITISWHEENIILKIHLRNVKINQTIDKNKWQLPTYHPLFDLTTSQ